MTDRSHLPEELELLAAEYALGLLDQADRARAADLQATDEEFAARVAKWRDLGSYWLVETDPVPVGDHVWQRLGSIFDLVDGSGGDAAGTLAANDDSEEAVKWASAAHKWRNRSYLAAAASVVLAIALGTVVALGEVDQVQIGESEPIASADEPDNPSRNQLAVAQIADQEGIPLISVAFDPNGGDLRLRVAEFGATDKAPELWVLDPEGTPYSLGLVEDRTLTVNISDELRALLVEGAIIAVTLEDRETAPHDAPTGAILGTGALVIL